LKINIPPDKLAKKALNVPQMCAECGSTVRLKKPKRKLQTKYEKRGLTIFSWSTYYSINLPICPSCRRPIVILRIIKWLALIGFLIAFFGTIFYMPLVILMAGQHVVKLFVSVTFILLAITCVAGFLQRSKERRLSGVKNFTNKDVTFYIKNEEFGKQFIEANKDISIDVLSS